MDMPSKKIFRSKDANYLFDKKNGTMHTWGNSIDEDAEMFPAPTIADIEVTTICDNGCSFCLLPGTKIKILDGFKNIEDLSIGDKVISYDEDAHCEVVNTVKEIYERSYSGVIIKLELEDGRIVKITPEHPVFVKNKGWILASDLTDDMEVVLVS